MREKEFVMDVSDEEGWRDTFHAAEVDADPDSDPEALKVGLPFGWRSGMLRPTLYGTTLPQDRPGAEVDFPPVVNGIDYLLSVTTRLAGRDSRLTPRDLKYAILHLQAAAEVLVKYRLQLEHWSLVFKDPGMAKKEDLASGELSSCTLSEAGERLRRIVGLALDEKALRELQQLGRSRNKLQHWGLSAPARAVEAQAAKVLDFLVRFLDEHLFPILKPEELSLIEWDMGRIRMGLTQIQSFVSQRMKRLNAELKEFTDRTVECPDCGQWTLVVGGSIISCRFCSVERDASAAAEIYMVEIVTFPSPPTGEWAWPAPCPDCGEVTLVSGARVCSAPDTPGDICFHCGEEISGIDLCQLCGVAFRPHDTEIACSDCFAERVGRRRR
ncbi:hypothetical protein [Streptomyces sp. 891-h]|uniref:hypothetical protein n=1 Tax=Streptomyces sp. 891-h TaxID=2720714 RepID=UPI001FA9452C|nr:hypothetical protein [Streptomyces sp. 891-h]UNZ18509.1 hypothetical protein HC362_17155 [Streptomyces sp. 891-h]